MNKRSETQTLRAGCSNAEPKIFAPPQTPFPGARDGQNLISWIYLQTQFGEDRCTQFRVIVVTDPQTYTHKHKTNEKKRLERHKHCALAIVRRSQKISPAADTLPGGAGRPKFNQLGDGHYLYLQTQFGEDRCTQFRVVVVTDPQTHTHPHTHKQTNPQTGPITIQCAAAS